MESEECCLLSLPLELLDHIALTLTYEELSACRLVCKKLDRFCQQQLNKGFASVDKFHDEIQREVKRQLPRRESERRTHPLARHVDILAAIETRLSLLSMTYNKYISSQVCCFIPGKVLDEMYRVLKYIRHETSVPRSHETLQELRDISSMAMEHFDEKIVPGLKGKLSQANSSVLMTTFSPNPNASKCITGPHDTISTLQTSTTIGHRIADLDKKVTEQNAKIVEQDRKMTEQSRKISKQDQEISELGRKMVEYDQKFLDFMNEVAHVRGLGRSLSKRNTLQVENTGADTSSSDTTKEAGDKESSKNFSSSSPVIHTAEPGQTKRPAEEMTEEFHSSKKLKAHS